MAEALAGPPAAPGEAENYRILAEYSTDLVARLSVEGLCLYVSPSCQELLGYSPEELLGRRVFDFIHPLDMRAVSEALEPEILFGRHRRLLCRLRRRDGHFGWFESKFRFFDDRLTGELQLIVSAREVGDRVRAERFAAVRHSIAALKTTEAELEREFSSLLGAICGTLTWDMGELWLVEEERPLLRRSGLWCGSSSRLRRLAEAEAGLALAPGVGLPGSIWARGEATVVDELSSSAFSLQREGFREAGLRSAIGTVLVDEARVYGVLVFLSRRQIQRNQELLDMIAETGSELGGFLAKYRARKKFEAESEKLGALVEEGEARIRALQTEVGRQQRLEQDILLAAEVQRNLLPGAPPSCPGLEISAAALPARYISGDFYDFASPSPEACDVLIADVSGKGIAAAMITTAARTIFRTAAGPRGGPGRAIELMNAALRDDLARTEKFLTAQCLRVEPREGRITYASAGHTEGLRWRPSAGRCLRLPSTAVPIGVLEDIGAEELAVPFRPGDFFVMYSDGVTEATDAQGELFGMDRLLAVVEDPRHASAAALADALLAAVRAFSGDNPPSDDLTLVVLRSSPRTLRLRVPPSMDRLDEAAAFVRGSALPYGVRAAEELELAASELVTNAVKHAEGPGEVEISLALEPGRLVLEISYPGRAFDPAQSPQALPEPLQEGGRGLLIVRALADELSYAHDHGSARNSWRLVKKLPAEDDP